MFWSREVQRAPSRTGNNRSRTARPVPGSEVPEAQVDAILGYFDLYGGAAEITSAAEYRNGMAIYAASDAHLSSDDVHSAVARYVIHLGTRLAEWDGKHTVPKAPL